MLPTAVTTILNLTLSSSTIVNGPNGRFSCVKMLTICVTSTAADLGLKKLGFRLIARVNKGMAVYLEKVVYRIVKILD